MDWPGVVSAVHHHRPRQIKVNNGKDYYPPGLEARVNGDGDAHHVSCVIHFFNRPQMQISRSFTKSLQIVFVPKSHQSNWTQTTNVATEVVALCVGVCAHLGTMRCGA